MSKNFRKQIFDVDALPAGLPGEEAAELAAGLRDRADLDEVLVWEEPEGRSDAQ